MNLSDSRKDRSPIAVISNSGSFILNESENHFGRPSIMTSSLLIKDITNPIKVWDVEEIYEYAKLPCCYAFYNKYGVLLYIGKASDLWKRYSGHMHSAITNTTSVEVNGRKFYLWRKFHSVRLFQLSENDSQYLEYLEQCLFHFLKPAHNIWKLEMISDEDYIKILEKSPSHDEKGISNGWESDEIYKLQDALQNWPKKDDLIKHGIIKENENYKF